MRTRAYIAGLAVAALLLAGCAGLVAKSGEDYKKLVAARANAQLVGSKVCWNCHINDTHAGAAPGAVNCEDCHGPGELAVKDMHEEDGRLACNYETFINIGELPKQAQTGICMNCHSRMATFNLHNWNAGAHNLNGVSCIDCHNIHHGRDLKPARAQVAKLCVTCHQEVRGFFALPTHHPLPEGKIVCTDCHNPHGSPAPTAMLVRDTIKETCARCHAEKEGPFVFEHADLMEECTNCHLPHGSPNDNLLTARQPILCKQCHAAHRLSDADPARLRTYGGNCTDCHSTIHGTDLDGPSAGGESFLFR